MANTAYPYPQHHCGVCALTDCVAREPGFPGEPGSSPCRDYAPATAHTPGPWHVGVTPDTARSIYATEGRMRLGEGGTTLYPIAWTVDFDGDAETNARLIAASPDLLAACRMALAHMYAEELDAPTAAELERRLMEAIAKAGG